MSNVYKHFENVLFCNDTDKIDHAFNEFNKEIDKVCTEQGIDIPCTNTTILKSTHQRLSDHKSNLEVFENTLADAILEKRKLHLFEKSFILPRHATNINKLIDKIMHNYRLTQDQTYIVLPPLFIQTKENDITPFSVDHQGIFMDQITFSKDTNLYLIHFMDYQCIIPLFHQDFIHSLKKSILKKIIHNLYFLQDVVFTEAQLRRHLSNQRELVLNILNKRN